MQVNLCAVIFHVFPLISLFQQKVYRMRLPHSIQNPNTADHFIRYRNMCRFQSRGFYKQELVLPYRYYWRVEYVVSTPGLDTPDASIGRM